MLISVELPDSGMILVNTGNNSVSLWNPTASFIWHSSKDMVPQQIAVELAETFNLPVQSVLADVVQTLKMFDELVRVQESSETVSDQFDDETRTERHFNISGYEFSIKAPALFQSMFWPMWQHLQSNFNNAQTAIEIRADKSGCGKLYVNGAERVDTSPAHVLMGGIYQYILEALHPQQKWCAFVHSGCVAKNNKAIILAAPSGSGKSTLTAYLVHCGFDYLSDDLVPITRNSSAITPWPLPISVKTGAVKTLAAYYPKLKNQADVQPQYLIQNSTFMDPMPQAAVLVFPKYVAGSKTIFEDITVTEALTKLMEDRIHFGYPVDDKNVSHFVDLIARIPRKSLEYSNLEEAEKCLSNLLKD
jgi:hypothetical protein